MSFLRYENIHEKYGLRPENEWIRILSEMVKDI